MLKGLYKVCRGSCRVEQDGKTVAFHYKGEIFGEINFLENNPATVSGDNIYS
jgi:CRP-like cAMP-binding protein